METNDTATQKHLSLNGRSFLLVGTAHVSQRSIEEVTGSIESGHPDVVAIELDQKRFENLSDPESWRTMDLIKVFRQKQGFLMLANVVLSAYQKRMGAEAGVRPGDEMLAAIVKARELSIPQVMVDRPIAITLRRAWAKNSLWGKCKLLSALVTSAFSKDSIDVQQVEELKERSEMDSMMKELSEYLPAIKEVLIDERDRYLASKIWQCTGKSVLAVLGAGHLSGVQAHLEKLAAGEASPDCTDISEVPKKTLGAKIASWTVPVLIVALIVLGFVYGGKKSGWNMLGAWVLWNGILAAVGALAAGAHPLAVLVSFAGAPLTSLCPFIGIGIVSGIVQAAVCKPKVSDMEAMSQDATSFSGFYRNRILRALLVFMFSSIGSSIGTFVAGASFVKTISGFFYSIIHSFKK